MKHLLIANRGEIARRVIRTAHRMGIATVAVYSDVDTGALHVAEASRAFALGGNSSAESYLRIDKLLAAARASGADAVHPGYGFLSENADFAQAVLDAGLIWVGPPPAAIRALGSKSAAKRLALGRGVPCLPGYQGEDQSDARFITEAAAVGYPLMVKATAGGGGRGMRLVNQPGELPAALQSARSEAQSSFGNAELLLERALLRPRHVEVQVFADAHGHCIHLGERDCSVQRRHQKIIEESPSPAVDEVLRQAMGRCAVDLALAAGYVGAGTVEFLLDDGSAQPHPPAAEEGENRFYLMEMNTRLQVEHPVTEMLTGLDLVEWQIRIARGEPLPLRQEQVQRQGHAIEVRLCAEDENFAPHAGQVMHLRVPSPAHPPPPVDGGGGGLPGLRFDHALSRGMLVSPFYDSMLGKIIAHGPDRASAIARMRGALAQTTVLGLPTNRTFLDACLGHALFAQGQIRIPFLAEHAEDLRQGLREREQAVLLPAALAALLPPPASTSRAMPCAWERRLRVRWRESLQDLAVLELGHGRLRVVHAGGTAQVSLHWDSDATCVVEVDGLRHQVRAVQPRPGHWHVACDDTELWLQDVSFEPAPRAGAARPGDELRAPFNGRLIAVPAVVGAQVRRGDLLAVLESMKLEHALCAARDGTIATVPVQAGQQVATAQLLISFEPAA